MKWKLPVNKVYRLILLVVVIVILLFILLAITKNYFNSPSVGTINTLTTRATTTTSLLSAEGKTFSFSYPSSFLPGQSKQLSKGDVEKLSFITTDQSPWNLDIQIRQLAGGQISNDGSYNLRKTNPDIYTEQVVKLNSNTAYIMASNTGVYNKVVFIVNGKIDATFHFNLAVQLTAQKWTPF